MFQRLTELEEFRVRFTNKVIRSHLLSLSSLWSTSQSILVTVPLFPFITKQKKMLVTLESIVSSRAQAMRQLKATTANKFTDQKHC